MSTELRTNQEIRESFDESTKNKMSGYQLQNCPDCDSTDFVSYHANEMLTPEFINLLDSKFIVLQGCSFGTAPIIHYTCRKCNKKY